MNLLNCMANVDCICGNKVIHNFAVSWRSGYSTTRWCKSRTNSTQPVTPILFFWVSERTYAIIIFSHPDGSFKTLPSRTICACVGDVWWPVVWYCSCSGAGKSFCLSLRGDSWQSHGHAKQHLLAYVWTTLLLMQPMFESQRRHGVQRQRCTATSSAVASATHISCSLKGEIAVHPIRPNIQEIFFRATK